MYFQYNLDTILDHLKDGRPYNFISDIFDIDRSDIKDVVSTYLPEFSQEKIINVNKDEIHELLYNDVPIFIIAHRYGLKQRDLCKYVIDHLPGCAVERMDSIKLDKSTGDIWMYSGSLWFKIN